MIALLADEQGPELIGEILAIGSFGFLQKRSTPVGHINQLTLGTQYVLAAKLPPSSGQSTKWQSAKAENGSSTKANAVVVPVWYAQ